MRLPPPSLSTTLADLAFTLGELWGLQGRLTSLTVSRDLKLALLLEEARRIGSDLASIRDRLARRAAELGGPESALGPLPFAELLRADLECVLVDRLDPALAALASPSSAESGASRAPSRAGIECVLADHLNPAIAVLVRLLLSGACPGVTFPPRAEAPSDPLG